MASIWTMDIPTIVFSRIVSDFSEDLKTKYGMKKLTVNGITTWRNFSTSQVSETPPIFPYITIIETAGVEDDEDLEGDTINADRCGFQIDVYDNQNETRARNCIKEITRIMKTMRFRGAQMPSPNSEPQIYRMTARFARKIADNDIL